MNKNLMESNIIAKIKATSDFEKVQRRSGAISLILTPQYTPLLANMAFMISLIRHFEEKLLELAKEDCIHGPVHTSIGHEACAAGTMAALKSNDKIFSTHRAHHHYLAKLIHHFTEKGFSILNPGIPETLQTQITNLLGEIMGLSIGCCGGRGGSMHLRNPQIGILGTNAIVAGGIPLATGAAFAEKYRKSNNIVICFLGDGAVNQGSFHEALNLAGLWKLPIVYIIENNLYAVATSIKTATASHNLACKANAYGFEGIVIDGMNPLEVMTQVHKSAMFARLGKGPTLIEANCYRYLHHAGPIPGSKFGYRQKSEEDSWLQRDPYIHFSDSLLSKNLLTSCQLQYIEEAATAAVQTATDFCIQNSEDKYTVKQHLLPTINSIEFGIKSDGNEFDNIHFHEIEDFTEFESKTYVKAITEVTHNRLRDNPDTFVVGEEVANFGGGPYGATKGLPSLYPDRILNTPISECGFVGLAGGAAIAGLRPIVEIMFPDFSLVAADQLFNQLGKLRHIYNNTTDMPVVVRTRVAIGCGYGGQHSMDPVGLFSLFNGWRVVAPSNSFDYIGLFNSAYICKDPVLIIEHHGLYNLKSMAPKDNVDYFIKLGKAKKVRDGNDVTVLCYSATVNLVQQAAQALLPDIDTEIIDLRTVSPNDIDYETIGTSLKKTNTMVIVEQAPLSMGISNHIVSKSQRLFFDYLKTPITTVQGRDIPLPVSKVLEASCIPDVEMVKDAIHKAVRRSY